MRRLLLTLPILLILALASAASAQTKPVLLETTPTIGARSVSPNLSEVVVRFSVPMSRSSWSWCGGGAAFPELTGRPFFRDDYTAVLPVTLKPEHSYRFSVNCPSAQNFRSAEGVSAEITPFFFTTAGVSQFPVSNPENARAYEETLQLITDVYSHRDRLGIDWEALFEEHRPWVLRAPDAGEWVTRTATLLAKADDPHLYFRTPEGARYSTHRRRGVYNANTRAIRARMADYTEHNDLVCSGRAGMIGYLAIRGWSNSNGEMDVIPWVLRKMEDADALIIDVRENGGGSEPEAKKLAARFLPKPVVYATHRYRDPDSPEGWGATRERWIQPGIEPMDDRPVAVLQGPVCLSSNEAFLLMMRQAPNAELIGEPSGGSSANARSFPLSNGAHLIVPRWQSMTPSGKQLEGVGIKPDIFFEGDYTEQDPLLDFAIERLNKRINE